MENVFTNVFIVQDIENWHGVGRGNKNRSRNAALLEFICWRRHTHAVV